MAGRRRKGIYSLRQIDRHALNRFFESNVEVKRIRNGEHQTLETLVNEEALLSAKYIRKETEEWVSRRVQR